MHNNNKISDKYIGNRYETNQFGWVTVVETIPTHENGKKSNCKYFKVQFDNTGSYNIAQISAIKAGRVKDKFAPFIAGVGYLGDFEGKVTDKDVIPFYHSWNDMMNRCYNISDKDYPLYGGLGIKVADEWHCFNTFLNDCKNLPNYAKKAQYPDKYQLDKDYLQYDIPKSERVYSKDTCIWASKYDNIMMMGFERFDPITGYNGVIYKDNTYCVRIRNKIFGRYTNAIAAANAYNYLTQLFSLNNPYRGCIILNNVQHMPPEEFLKYQIRQKQMYHLIDKS